MSNDKDLKYYPGGTPVAGFPWMLVIQILITILTYLMQRASTKPERDHFASLKAELSRWEVKR